MIYCNLKNSAFIALLDESSLHKTFVRRGGGGCHQSLQKNFTKLYCRTDVKWCRKLNNFFLHTFHTRESIMTWNKT